AAPAGEVQAVVDLGEGDRDSGVEREDAVGVAELAGGRPDAGTVVELERLVVEGERFRHPLEAHRRGAVAGHGQVTGGTGTAAVAAPAGDDEVVVGDCGQRDGLVLVEGGAAGTRAVDAVRSGDVTVGRRGHGQLRPGRRLRRAEGRRDGVVRGHRDRACGAGCGAAAVVAPAGLHVAVVGR